MQTKENISQLKIGYTNVAVIEVAAAEKDYDYGEWDSDAKTITINNELNETDTINTLLHEVLHAILWERGISTACGILDNREKDEENIVNALSNGLTQVFQDNPQFLKKLSLLSKP